MLIRIYQPGDLAALLTCFQRAVHAIDPQIYSPAQQSQWAPQVPETERWRLRLSQQEVFLAVQGQALAGFISLAPEGLIDYLYVDPDFQRQGMAQHLYDCVEALALSRGYQRLSVEASQVARPFFEKQGFVLISVNHHSRGDQVLVNYSLEKHLPGSIGV